MCWSFEVSLFTVLLVYSTFFILLLRRHSQRDLWNAIFLFVFGNMQTIDLLLWLTASQEDLSLCSRSNQLLTRLGFYVIVLEPFASLLARSSSGLKPSRKELFVYLIVCVVMPYLSRGWFLAPDCEMRYCTRLTKQEHLMLGIGVHKDGSNSCWRDGYVTGAYTNEIPLVLRMGFLLTIIYPYLFMKPFFSGAIQIAIVTLTWLVGYFSDSHASIWCWANVFQCVTMLLDPYLMPKKRMESPKIIRSKYESILMDRYSKSSIPKDLDAIIIGSGIGGLTTGVLLAKSGKKVLVLEQHYRAGGCTHTFDEFGGFFDSGIHYVGSKETIEPLLSYTCVNPPELELMGSKEDGFLYDRFELDKGFWVEYRKGWDMIEKELVKKFPTEVSGIKKLKTLRAKATRIAYFMVLLKFLSKYLPLFLTNWMYRKLEEFTKPTAESVVNGLFKDQKLRTLIAGGQLIDWNLQPNKVSWWVAIAMMNYYINGGYYPAGGSHLMAEGMIPIIERAGGRVLCREPVVQILLEEGSGKAIGVQMRNGDRIYGKIVVSDAGVANTRLLLKDQKSKETLPLLKASNGHMTAFVTLDKNFRELEITAANVHSMPGLKEYGYDLSKMQEAFYKDPLKQAEGCLVTITCPSAKDKVYDEKYPNECNVLMLTEGKFEWFNESCGPHGNRSEAYKAYKKQFEKLFLDRLFAVFPKTRQHVKSIEIGTPLSTKYYLNSPEGESYGLELTPERFSVEVMRKLEPETKIKGLYITGESAFFGGLAGAMVSGWITTFHVLGVWGMVKLVGWMEREDKEERVKRGKEKNE